MDDSRARLIPRAILATLLPWIGATAQVPAAPGEVDDSGAFLRLPLPPAPTPLVRGKDLAITRALYADYLLSQAGRSLLGDLTFDVLLARECAARGLAADAAKRAPALASARLARLGRDPASDPSGDLRRRLTNEALRTQRVAALVRADRKATETDLRALFDERYGVDGHKVKVRHLFASIHATERQLDPTLDEPTREAKARAAARARAESWHARLGAGTPFDSLLAESDEPRTQSLLRDPRFRAEAGLIPDYNYQQYGSSFADAVRQLEVGKVSGPIETSHGWHLIQLLERRVTQFADVHAELERMFLAQPPSPDEERGLRTMLFRKYEVDLGD